MKKTLLRSLLALTLVASTLVPALAENWVRIGDGHYIDAESVRQSTNYGTYTMRTKYISSGAPLEVINGRDIWTIKTNSYVDCTANYAKTVTYTAYDKIGRIVATGRGIGKQWYDINNPGSRAYESYAFVCTDRYLHERPGYDSLWLY